jgi:hypothetical protein
MFMRGNACHAYAALLRRESLRSFTMEYDHNVDTQKLSATHGRMVRGSAGHGPRDEG